MDSLWHLSSAKDMRRIIDTRLMQVGARFSRLGGLRCHSSKRCCLPNHLTTVAAEGSTFASWAHLGASELPHVSAMWTSKTNPKPLFRSSQESFSKRFGCESTSTSSNHTRLRGLVPSGPLCTLGILHWVLWPPQLKPKGIRGSKCLWVFHSPNSVVTLRGSCSKR